MSSQRPSRHDHVLYVGRSNAFFLATRATPWHNHKYFGNAMGESGNSAANTFVDGSDFAGARDHTHSFLARAPVYDPYDFNRDSFVDGSDLAIPRDNNTNFLTALKLLDLSGGASTGVEAVAALDALAKLVADKFDEE